MGRRSSSPPIFSVISRASRSSHAAIRSPTAPRNSSGAIGCRSAAGGRGTFLIVAFAITTYVQSLRIAAERDRAAQQRELAEHERARAEEVSSFLVNLFKLSDPEENRGNQVTARELLDSGAKRLRGRSARSAGNQGSACCPRSAPSTTAWDNTRTRCRYWTNPCLCSRSRMINRASIRCWSSASARIGAGDLTGAEQPLQEALHLSQGQFRRQPVKNRAARLWALGRLRQQQGQIRRGQGSVQARLAYLGNDAAPANRYFRGARRSRASLLARAAMGARRADL